MTCIVTASLPIPQFQNDKCFDFPQTYKWDIEDITKFQHALMHSDTQDKLQKLQSKQNNNRSEIDQSVKQFEDILLLAAKNSLRQRKQTKKANNTNSFVCFWGEFMARQSAFGFI